MAPRTKRVNVAPSSASAAGADDALGLHELAGLFRVSEKGVRGWIAAGLPTLTRGTRGRGATKTTISLRAAVQWYFDSNHERLELDRARTRHANEQAAKLEIERALKLRQIILAEHVDDLLSRMASQLSAQLEGLPGRVATELAGISDAAVIRTRLLAEVRAVRSAMAQFLTDESNGANAAPKE